MITTRPQVGDTYLYLLKVDPAIISASSMAPERLKVRVTAVDDKDVWYRLTSLEPHRDTPWKEERETRTTSIERFMSIVDILPETIVRC